MPPISCKPCRVTFEGTRYFVAKDGKVYPTWKNEPTGTWSLGEELAPADAQKVRWEAQRQRRNRNARERDAVRRDLGLVKRATGGSDATEASIPSALGVRSRATAFAQVGRVRLGSVLSRRVQ
jgi:hypothetical protein